MKEFTEKVELSEITVDKLSKEIDRIIQKKKINKFKKRQPKSIIAINNEVSVN